MYPDKKKINVISKQSLWTTWICIKKHYFLLIYVNKVCGKLSSFNLENLICQKSGKEREGNKCKSFKKFLDPGVAPQ